MTSCSVLCMQCSAHGDLDTHHDDDFIWIILSTSLDVHLKLKDDLIGVTR